MEQNKKQTMTPTEKAKELYEIMSMGQELDIDSDKMKSQSDAQGIPSPHWYMNSKYTPKNKYAKECALKSIDETLFALNSVTDKYIELGMRTFYQEVKQEIEKL